MNFKVKGLLYNMPFVDYFVFKLSFLVAASQVAF